MTKEKLKKLNKVQENIDFITRSIEEIEKAIKDKDTLSLSHGNNLFFGENQSLYNSLCTESKGRAVVILRMAQQGILIVLNDELEYLKTIFETEKVGGDE